MHFVDTSFLVARFNKRDTMHGAALEFIDPLASSKIPRQRLVLSDYVFDEMITGILSRTRNHGVAAQAGLVVRNSRSSEIIVVDRPVIEAAWKLFLDRPDKLWSFTDCTSFVLMQSLGIRTAVTFDENFRQFGFETLP